MYKAIQHWDAQFLIQFPAATGAEMFAVTLGEGNAALAKLFFWIGLA